MEFTVNALLLASCIVTNYNIKGIYEVSWNVEQVHKNSGFRKTMEYFDNEVHMQKILNWANATVFIDLIQKILHVIEILKTLIVLFFGIGLMDDAIKTSINGQVVKVSEIKCHQVL